MGCIYLLMSEFQQLFQRRLIIQNSGKNPVRRSEAKEYFTRSLLKYQSRQPPANRTQPILNQKRNWERGGEFAEKKEIKAKYRPSMLAVDI
jgi:hypothetical protein